MTGTEFLALIRPRIGDSAKATYDDNELLGYSYRDWETDRKSTRLNSSHSAKSRMPSSA